MNRRDSVLGLLVLGAAPLASLAQQQPRKIPRVGWLIHGTQSSQEALLLEEYRRGMRDLGYVEGRTVKTEYVYSNGQADRLAGLAAALVAHNVDVILAGSTPGCLAAMQATKLIPIIFPSSSDPISTGLVASLARPGGNVTGLSKMAPELSPKRLEVIHLLMPRVNRMAALWDSSNPGMALRIKETRIAAQRLRIAFFDAGARDLEGLEASFAELSKQRPDALLVTAEPFTRLHRDRILDFVARNHIPTMYEDDLWVEEGGLMSYGPSIRAMFRRAATYVDKVLKGAKPADLPVEQPTNFELTINMKTAKALGITIPPSLLARADRVIE